MISTRSKNGFSLCPTTLLLLCYCLFLHCCSGRNTITLTTPISDGANGSETLISTGKSFELGFFTPGGAKDGRRYVGIWYRNDPETIVWVANRDNPLHSSSGTFEIARDGNIHVFDRSNISLWSTGLDPSSISRTASLADTGNLVLRDVNGNSSQLPWESFEYPTDTLLPGMNMSEEMTLVSWGSPQDPKQGDYTFKQIQGEQGRYQIQKGINPYWESDSSAKILGNPDSISISDLISHFAVGTNKSPSKKQNLGSIRNVSERRLVMEFSGEIRYFERLKGTTVPWRTVSSEPSSPCALYGACGRFSLCSVGVQNANFSSKKTCTCLPGYKDGPSPENGTAGESSSDCISEEGADFCTENFTTVNFSRIGRPDSDEEKLGNETDCRKKCVENCRCRAYFSMETKKQVRTDPGKPPSNRSVHCGFWFADVSRVEQVDGGGQPLFVRRAVASLNVSGGAQVNQSGGAQVIQSGGKPLPSRKGIISIAVVALAVLAILAFTIASISYFRRRRVARNPGTRTGIQGNPAFRMYHSEESRAKELINEGKEGIDVPFFDFESILVATDYFSDTNKLGQGGFGPVYKGTFNGQDIAIKKLSSGSGQGLKEFKNEVVLIAKLQHRNLVRLLGYCIQEDEQILLYEYMPNRSLDAFIFDRSLCLTLNWEKRFDIILGIARGLLYLHQDSRLRIIHRDLKTSNILLDEEMNPKISDFGLAKIVGGKQMEANTDRIVGTYGYMSPEYALDGFFSVKSDVFSFGVVLLEIISGKRNTGFYQSEEALSLLGYAWRLWREDNAINLMEPLLREDCNTREVLKCINIGLLCVQEDPNDRPNMSTVVVMLIGETVSLPIPKRPAFTVRRGLPGSSSSSSKAKVCSNLELTVTVEEGR